MTKLRGGIVTTLFALTLAALLQVAPGCGGGGSDGSTIVLALTADFIPTSTADPNTITMQKGTQSGSVFSVPIRVAGVNDFFGAAFHVTFDTTKVAPISPICDTTTSFLRDGGTASTDLHFGCTLQGGDITIDATRIQNAGGTVTGVDVTTARDLMTLNFRAIAATGSTSSGISFADPKLVCDSTQPVCTSIPVAFFGGSVLAN